MNRPIFIFLLLFLFSCQEHKNTEDLKLEIVNEKILCASGTENKEVIASINDKKNKGKNIITFKITNNSKKNFFLVLNEDGLETFSMETLNSTDFLKKARICFVIEPDDHSKIESYTIIGDHFTKKSNECTNSEINRIVELKSKLKDLGYPDIADFEFSNSIRKNSFVLHPNETRYFKTILSLPNYNDQVENSSLLSYYKFNSKKNYNFKLQYLTDSKTLKERLPKFKIDELRENNVEIFNGVVVSNEVPIVFVK